MKNEADVKKEVKKILKKLHIYQFMPVPVMYSRTGVPDFFCCVCGKFVTIETKFGYNKPSPRQEIEMRDIRDSGGITYVINEKNVNTLEARLSMLMLGDLKDEQMEKNS